MKRKQKTRWVTALRSGVFRQGKCSLRSPDLSFCCLGVLCEVEGIPHGDDGRTYEFPTGEKHHGVLPPHYRMQLGITEVSMRELVQLNDNGASFAEIANWIENYL